MLQLQVSFLYFCKQIIKPKKIIALKKNKRRKKTRVAVRAVCGRLFLMELCHEGIK
jgi:hypothetical protein